MGVQPASYRVSDFRAGMDLFHAPSRLPPGVASLAYNVDTSDGTIRAFYGFGTTVVGTGTSGDKSFMLHDGASVTLSTFPQRNDVLQAGTDAVTGYLLQLRTAKTSSTAANIAAYSNGVTLGSDLGADPPTLTATTPGAGAARSYRVTAYSDGTNNRFVGETNPSAAVTNNYGAGAVLTFGALPTNYNLYRLYATAVGSTTEPYHLIAEQAGTTYNDTGPTAVPTGARVLNWQAGGNPFQNLYKYDNAKAPNLTVLSNRIHGVAAGGLADGVQPRQQGVDLANVNGIAFGAIANTVRWSETGFAQYWPAVNAFRCDGPVVAMVTDLAATYAFTTRSVYVFTGTRADRITVTRARCDLGCLRFGFAVLTPYGVAFSANGGIGLFDGSSARLLTAQMLNSDDWLNIVSLVSGSTALNRDVAAAYYDGHLYVWSMQSSLGPIILDFASWPEVSMTLYDATTAADDNVQAAFVSPVTSTPGLYIMERSTVQIRSWRPRERGYVDGASPLPWRWVSGVHQGGTFTEPKRWMRAWLEATGSPSFSFQTITNPSTTVATTVLTASDYLGETHEGDGLQVDITSTNGAGVVYGLEVEYEVLSADR